MGAQSLNHVLLWFWNYSLNVLLEKLSVILNKMALLNEDLKLSLKYNQEQNRRIKTL